MKSFIPKFFYDILLAVCNFTPNSHYLSLFFVIFTLADIYIEVFFNIKRDNTIACCITPFYFEIINRLKMAMVEQYNDWLRFNYNDYGLKNPTLLTLTLTKVRAVQ